MASRASSGVGRVLIFMLRKSGRARVTTLASATAHRLRDFPGRRGAARERKL